MRKIAIAISAIVFSVAVALYAVVHDEVAAMRVRVASAPPPSRVVVAAVLATEGKEFLARRPLLPPLACLKPKVLCCGPASASDLVSRRLCKPRRAALWQMETALVSATIARLFTPDEILAVFIDELHPPAGNLTVAQAAFVAAKARRPHPSLERRNRVLELMLDNHAITDAEYRAALAEP